MTGVITIGSMAWCRTTGTNSWTGGGTSIITTCCGCVTGRKNRCVWQCNRTNDRQGGFGGVFEEAATWLQFFFFVFFHNSITVSCRPPGLDWLVYKKEAWKPVSLLFPPIEALALPIGVGRATPKPHAVWYDNAGTSLSRHYEIIPEKASTVASFLTPMLNLRDSYRSRMSADKRSCYVRTRHWPISGFGKRYASQR